MGLIGLEEDYRAVRAAIDLQLGEATLPSATIGMPVFQGAAEAEVLRRDPDAATRTGHELDLVQQAVIFWTAALVMPALPVVLEDRFGDVDTRLQGPNIAARVAQLRAAGDAALDALLAPYQDTSGIPTFFTVATARRGRAY